MSEFRIDQIKNQAGTSGPNIAGITTFTGTSGIVIPSGDTRYRYSATDGEIVKDGLVLWLDAGKQESFGSDGTVWRDLSGQDNNGTLSSGVGFTVEQGGSLIFDGINDHISAGALSGSFTSFTVIVWFYPTSVTNHENPIDCNYSYNGTTGNIGPRLEMENDGRLTWVYSNITNSNNSYYYHLVVSSGLAANTWHCAAITYDGGTNTSTTYHNGNASGLSRLTVGSPTGFVGVMNNVTIGKGFHLGGGERIFTGRVSNVSIYNKALTTAEIQQNFNALRSRYGL